MSNNIVKNKRIYQGMAEVSAKRVLASSILVHIIKNWVFHVISLVPFKPDFPH